MPPARRIALVEEVKALYSAEAPEGKDFDRINRMDGINPSTNPVAPVHPVQTDATSYSAAPDSVDPAFKCGDSLLDFWARALRQCR